MKIKVKKADGKVIKSMAAKKGMITVCGGRIIRINKTTITVFYINRRPLERLVRVEPADLAISLKDAKKYGFKYMTRKQFEKSLVAVDLPEGM